MPTFLQDNRMLAWILAGVAFLIAFVLILKIVEILADLRRRLPRGSRSRQLRLGFVESFDLDGERQLLLVRRDNIEHLVMVGGPNDVLVESGIVRVEPREARAPRSSEAVAGVTPPPAPIAPHHAPTPVELPSPVASEPVKPHPILAAAPPAFTPLPLEELPQEARALEEPRQETRPQEDRPQEERPQEAHAFAPHPLEPHPLAFPAPESQPVAPPPAPVSPPPERPASRFPLPPRVGPSLRTPAFPPPRFTPAGPAGAPGSADPAAKPRFVMPPLARRTTAPPPAETIPAEPASAPPPAVTPPLPPLSSLPPLPPLPSPAEIAPPPAPAPEPPVEIKTQTGADSDFEPIESLEEEMAKLLGRPLNR